MCDETEHHVEFIYQYRDGGNYKNASRHYFPLEVPGDSDPHDRLDLLVAEMREFLDAGRFFIADQLRLPNQFLWSSGAHPIDPDIDHCWHEFVRAKVTSRGRRPDDRSFGAFVTQVARAAEGGWNTFDPADRRE